MLTYRFGQLPAFKIPYPGVQLQVKTAIWLGIKRAKETYEKEPEKYGPFDCGAVQAKVNGGVMDSRLDAERLVPDGAFIELTPVHPHHIDKETIYIVELD